MTTEAPAPVIDFKTCEVEFERIAYGWDLDIDTAAMEEEEDRRSFEALKRRLIRAIGFGRLIVNEDKHGQSKMGIHYECGRTFVARFGYLEPATDTGCGENYPKD